MNHLQQRRAEEREQRREAIVDAAEQVFETTGFDASTMDEIARAARVSRALVYLYFKNKQEVSLAICQRALLLLRDKFIAASAAADNGHDQVAAIGRAYIQFANDHPLYFAAVSRFESHTPGDLEDDSSEYAVFQCGHTLHEITMQCLRNGIDDGSIRPDLDDLLAAALSLWASVHGMIQIAHTKEKYFERVGKSTERFFAYGIDFTMRALRPQRSTDGSCA